MTINDLIKTYEVALNANDLEKILALYGSEPVFSNRFTTTRPSALLRAAPSSAA